MEFTSDQEKRIRLYFRLSVLGKGLISAAEIIGGVVVLFVPITYFTDLAVRFAQAELWGTPGDFIATHLLSLAQEFSVASATFISFYLLSRGLVKLVLVVALLKNQLWAYPSSLVLLGLFVLYQIYQIATTHSGAIVALTLFDLLVMWFIWREYQVLRFERESTTA